MLKMGIITGFLSKTKDRFHEYNEPLDLDGKFELMTQIEGYDGVELVYPYEVNDAKVTKKLLHKYGLNIAAINVNVKAEPEFRNGGLTSHDKGVRAKAVRFIKEAKDFAAAVGADKVTCCPALLWISAIQSMATNIQPKRLCCWRKVFTNTTSILMTTTANGIGIIFAGPSITWNMSNLSII
jgi:sugar phosphate isomerase/epimerase